MSNAPLSRQDVLPVKMVATGFAAALAALNPNEDGPIYLRLKNALRDAIRSKAIRGEGALPPERDLAEDLNVSRITVRKAIDGLVEEGLLVRRRGSGTFVVGRVEKSFSKLTSFSEDMIARGRRPWSQWISRTRGVVTPDEALNLGLSPGSEIYRFRRLRYADDALMALEHAVVPVYCLSSVQSVADSLYAALEQTGFRPVRALQRLRGVAFGPDQAEWLKVEPGDAGLYIERRGFCADGRCCELTQSWFRGDAYDMVAELGEQQ